MASKRNTSHASDGTTVETLFQLPLDQFTAAKNALAAQLKKSGHRDAAARVKGLSKPPVSAWAVNQLFWNHRKPYDRLMDSGQRFREAQAAQGGGKTGGGAGALLPFLQRKDKPPRNASRKGDRGDDPRAQEEARRAQEAEAKAAVQHAQHALREAQHAAEEAEVTLKKAAARLKTAEQKKAEIDQQLEQLTAEVTAARQDARRI